MCKYLHMYVQTCSPLSAFFFSCDYLSGLAQNLHCPSLQLVDLLQAWSTVFCSWFSHVASKTLFSLSVIEHSDPCVFHVYDFVKYTSSYFNVILSTQLNLNFLDNNYIQLIHFFTITYNNAHLFLLSLLTWIPSTVKKLSFILNSYIPRTSVSTWVVKRNRFLMVSESVARGFHEESSDGSRSKRTRQTFARW